MFVYRIYALCKECVWDVSHIKRLKTLYRQMICLDRANRFEAARVNPKQWPRE